MDNQLTHYASLQTPQLVRDSDDPESETHFAIPFQASPDESLGFPPRRGSHNPAWGRATHGSAAPGDWVLTVSALKGRNRAVLCVALCRPFRACQVNGLDSQGVALGWFVGAPAGRKNGAFLGRVSKFIRHSNDPGWSRTIVASMSDWCRAVGPRDQCDRSGSRTHRHQALDLAALPVCVLGRWGNVEG